MIKKGQQIEGKKKGKRRNKVQTTIKNGAKTMQKSIKNNQNRSKIFKIDRKQSKSIKIN
jgi:hypothetical protein